MATSTTWTRRLLPKVFLPLDHYEMMVNVLSKDPIVTTSGGLRRKVRGSRRSVDRCAHRVRVDGVRGGRRAYVASVVHHRVLAPDDERDGDLGLSDEDGDQTRGCAEELCGIQEAVRQGGRKHDQLGDEKGKVEG